MKFYQLEGEPFPAHSGRAEYIVAFDGENVYAIDENLKIQLCRNVSKYDVEHYTKYGPYQWTEIVPKS